MQAMSAGLACLPWHAALFLLPSWARSLNTVAARQFAVTLTFPRGAFVSDLFLSLAAASLPDCSSHAL
jgi:hypothetical protein